MNEFVIHLTDRQIAALEEMVGTEIEDESDLEYAIKVIIDVYE